MLDADDDDDLLSENMTLEENPLLKSNVKARMHDILLDVPRASQFSKNRSLMMPSDRGDAGGFASFLRPPMEK